MAISNNTEISPGDTTILTCIGFGQPAISITWTHEGLDVVNSTLITVTETDFPEEGGRFMQSFLQICGAAVADFGVYTCVVSNSGFSVDASVQVAVAGECRTLNVICCTSPF